MKGKEAPYKAGRWHGRAPTPRTWCSSVGMRSLEEFQADMVGSAFWKDMPLPRARWGEGPAGQLSRSRENLTDEGSTRVVG